MKNINERLNPLGKLKKNFVLMSVLVTAFIAAFSVFGCSDSTSPEAQQGEVKITMIDAPAAFDNINIVVTRVEIHKAGADSNSGWFVINNNEATYDLLKIRNGASAVIGNKFVDEGHYTQIRLILGAGSNVVVNGIVFSLNVPGGVETALKLNHNFYVNADIVYELMLDFDAEKSIIYTGSENYKLKPVIRLIPVVLSGTISGTINPALAVASIYAVSGNDTVHTVAEISTGYFKLMALLEGSYNITVIPWNAAYSDTTVANVMVVAKKNTDLKTIILDLK